MDSNTARMPYALARHVFLCEAAGHVFLLDVKRDKYLALDATKARALCGWVEGWPPPPDGADPRIVPSERGRQFAQALLANGILSDRDSGKQATAVSVPYPGAQLLTDREAEGLMLGPALVFMATCLLAKLQFRYYKLERLIEMVRASRPPEFEPFDLGRARALVRVFVRLRPFFFASRDGCLFESFVLVRFLAHYGLFPHWVFGIRARPFGAHCWLQEGETVLNDSVEHVSRLTPIMLV